MQKVRSYFDLTLQNYDFLSITSKLPARKIQTSYKTVRV